MGVETMIQGVYSKWGSGLSDVLATGTVGVAWTLRCTWGSLVLLSMNTGQPTGKSAWASCYRVEKKA